jgi:hypothetical protein
LNVIRLELLSGTENEFVAYLNEAVFNTEFRAMSRFFSRPVNADPSGRDRVRPNSTRKQAMKMPRRRVGNLLTNLHPFRILGGAAVQFFVCIQKYRQAQAEKN